METPLLTLEEKFINFLHEITIHHKKYFTPIISTVGKGNTPTYDINSSRLLQLVYQTFTVLNNYCIYGCSTSLYIEYKNSMSIVLDLYNKNGNTTITSETLKTFTVASISIKYYFKNITTLREQVDIIERIFLFIHRSKNNSLKGYSKENTVTFINCFIQSIEYINTRMSNDRNYNIGYFYEDILYELLSIDINEVCIKSRILFVCDSIHSTKKPSYICNTHFVNFPKTIEYCDHYSNADYYITLKNDRICYMLIIERVGGKDNRDVIEGCLSTMRNGTHISEEFKNIFNNIPYYSNN